MSTLSVAGGEADSGQMREVTLGQAIREALAEEMRRDPTVFIMGEDVAEAGTAIQGAVWTGRRVRPHAHDRLAHL